MIFQKRSSLLHRRAIQFQFSVHIYIICFNSKLNGFQRSNHSLLFKNTSWQFFINEIYITTLSKECKTIFWYSFHSWENFKVLTIEYYEINKYYFIIILISNNKCYFFLSYLCFSSAHFLDLI